MKQIQDMEDRLGRAKQEIVQLRILLSQKQHESDGDLTHSLGQSSLNSKQAVERSILPSHAVGHKAQSLSMVALTWRRQTSSIFVEELPPQVNLADLLHIFEHSVYFRMPIVSLDDIRQKLDVLFQHGKLDDVPQAWRAMLMATIACSIQLVKRSGHDLNPDQYVQMAISALDQSWSGNMTVDHVRLALLLAIYFFEANAFTASAMWLQTACIIYSQTDFDQYSSRSNAGVHTRQALSTAIRWLK